MEQGQFTRNFELGVMPGDELGAPKQGNSRVFVEFYMMPVKDESRSAALGRAVHKDVEMIRIMIPGDRHNIPERRVREHDKVNYARQYEHFRKGEMQAAEGTRVDDWSVLTRAQVQDLKSMNIYTVEAIANISDSQLPALGLGGRRLREHAQLYLHNAEKGALPSQAVAELETLRNTNALLVQQLADLTRKVEIAMKQAGAKPEEITNPINEIKAFQPPKVDIPSNYQSLGLAKLKEICANLSAMPVTTKDDALEMIAEHLAQRKLVA